MGQVVQGSAYAGAMCAGASMSWRRPVRRYWRKPLAPWLTEQLTLISQKTKLAEAVRYTLSRWNGLTRFIGDDRIEIDSNTVERSIRPIALNRKSALFAGSDATAKLNRIEPLAYLTD